MISCMASSRSNSSVVDMECHCKCEFDSRALSLVSINMVRPLFRYLRVRNWWLAPRHHLNTTHCSSYSLRHAKCKIFLERLLELWFDHCLVDLDFHIDRMHRSKAPWNIFQSRQLVWCHGTCCHQLWPQSSRIREIFCTQISAHEFPRHMWRCMDSSRRVWNCWRWKKKN